MEVKICCGRSCQQKFSSYIRTRLENDKEKFDLRDVEISDTPCMGSCKLGPNIKIDGEQVLGVNPAKASELIFKKLKNATTKKYKNKKDRSI